MFWKKRQKIPVSNEAPVLPVLAEDMSNLLPEVVAVVDEILDQAAAEEEKVERLKTRGIRLLAPDAFQYGGHIYRSIGKAKWERIDAEDYDARAIGTREENREMFGWFLDSPQDKLKKDLRKKNIVVLPNTAEGMEGGLLEQVHKTSAARSPSTAKDTSVELRHEGNVEILSASAPVESNVLPGLIPHFASLKPQRSYLLSQHDRSTYNSGSSASQRIPNTPTKSRPANKLPSDSIQTDESSGTKNQEHSLEISSDGRDENSTPDLFELEINDKAAVKRPPYPETNSPSQQAVDEYQLKSRKHPPAPTTISKRAQHRSGVEEAVPKTDKVQCSKIVPDNFHTGSQIQMAGPSEGSSESGSKAAMKQSQGVQISARLNDHRNNHSEHSAHRVHHQHLPGKPSAARSCINATPQPDMNGGSSAHSTLINNPVCYRNAGGYKGDGITLQPRESSTSIFVDPMVGPCRERDTANPDGNYVLKSANKLVTQGEPLDEHRKFPWTVTRYQPQDQISPATQRTSPPLHPGHSGHLEDYNMMAQLPYDNDFGNENNFPSNKQDHFVSDLTQRCANQSANASEFARLKKRRELYHKRKNRHQTASNQKQAVGTTNAA
ncbi:hypothetical protein TWF696_003666 [Orbilia brochopaga]|uniref:Uncharacterized protein n=1 Tax=Orbilia brochopaga TaxID=3140254 RepID=A0AAV9V7J0_9PEZI